MMLNRITATDAYHQTVANNRPAERISAQPLASRDEGRSRPPHASTSPAHRHNRALFIGMTEHRLTRHGGSRLLPFNATILN